MYAEWKKFVEIMRREHIADKLSGERQKALNVMVTLQAWKGFIRDIKNNLALVAEEEYIKNMSDEHRLAQAEKEVLEEQLREAKERVEKLKELHKENNLSKM